MRSRVHRRRGHPAIPATHPGEPRGGGRNAAVEVGRVVLIAGEQGQQCPCIVPAPVKIAEVCVSIDAHQERAFHHFLSAEEFLVVPSRGQRCTDALSVARMAISSCHVVEVSSRDTGAGRNVSDRAADRRIDVA